MDVRRIEEEVDPDFLSDAPSRTSLAESGDSCESKIGIRANGYRELARSRLVSDSNTRDVEWEPIEEERLEEPKEGWMLRDR
ncbi:hypothetical protein Tco_0644644 [Tanacetum coccineum]